MSLHSDISELRMALAEMRALKAGKAEGDGDAKRNARRCVRLMEEVCLIRDRMEAAGHWHTILALPKEEQPSNWKNNTGRAGERTARAAMDVVSHLATPDEIEKIRAENRTPISILNAVAGVCGATADDVRGGGKHRKTSMARTISVVLARALTTSTLAEIAIANGLANDRSLCAALADRKRIFHITRMNSPARAVAVETISQLVFEAQTQAPLTESGAA